MGIQNWYRVHVPKGISHIFNGSFFITPAMFVLNAFTHSYHTYSYSFTKSTLLAFGYNIYSQSRFDSFISSISLTFRSRNTSKSFIMTLLSLIIFYHKRSQHLQESLSTHTGANLWSLFSTKPILCIKLVMIFFDVLLNVL